MSVFPDNNVIQDIASELRTDPIFIEKDWFVSDVIKTVAETQSERLIPIFCGGTSLMKGHKVIN